MRAVSSSNVIKHIASPEWNWNLPVSNVKNRGADPTKAKHQHITMLIKFFFFVKTFLVSRRKNIDLLQLLFIITQFISKKRNNCKLVHSKTLEGGKSFTKNPTIVGETCDCIRHITGGYHKSLTARAIMNMLGSVWSLWFLYMAKQGRRLSKRGKTSLTANKTVSIQNRDLARAASSRERFFIVDFDHQNEKR